MASDAKTDGLGPTECGSFGASDDSEQSAADSVICASEPLTYEKSWKLIPKDHMLIVKSQGAGKGLSVQVVDLDLYASFELFKKAHKTTACTPASSVSASELIRPAGAPVEWTSTKDCAEYVACVASC